MLRLLQSLCVVMLITSCAQDDPLYTDFSPEGMKVGFSVERLKKEVVKVDDGRKSYAYQLPSLSTGRVGSIPAMPTTTTTTVKPVFWDNVERWRPIVTESVYAWGGNDDDVHRFLRIMQCESAGLPDAKNPNSSASGLMQHLTRFWPDRAARAGLPEADVFDPYANIYVSAWLALEAAEGGWQHWLCK